MRVRHGVWVLVASVGVLAGCSSPPASQTSATSVAPTSSAAPAGPTAVTVGQQFEVSTPAGVPQAKVTFVAVEPSPTCTTRFGDPKPPAGTYVAVQLDVQTETGLDPQQFTNPAASDFSELKPDGYTKSDVSPASDLCTADREQIGLLSPSAKYRGWVLLDVTSPASTLVFKPRASAGTSTAAWSIGIPAAATPATTSAPAPSTTEDTTPAAAPTTTRCIDCPPPGSLGNPGGPRSRGIALVSCPTDQEPNTGLYADGEYDYAPECIAIRQSASATTPAADTGPGCGQRAVNKGVFNPSCSEYQGYLDPGTAGGRAPTSGELQTQYACQQGQLTGPVCDPYR